MKGTHARSVRKSFNRFIPSALRSRLSAAYSSGRLCDVRLVCSGAVFPAHIVLLAVHSEFFARMSGHGVIEVERVRPAHLDLLLRFLYHGEVSMPPSDYLAFLECAQFLGMNSLFVEVRKEVRQAEEVAADHEEEEREGDPKGQVDG